MDRLKQASRKLDAALSRLDQAVAQSAGPGGGGGDAELRAALDAAKAEHKALRAAAGQVTQRLDATVARLQKLLED
ncbi:MAG: hypothetical protein WDZ84_08290 [Rhodovibrionaceae bacterium]